MKAKIYCVVSKKGVHSFFLRKDNTNYYLFSQSYRKSVQSYFKRGVMLDNIMSFKKIHSDGALSHTFEKLPVYIKYIEKEYQIHVYDRTGQRKCKKHSERKKKDFYFDLEAYQWESA